MDPITVDEFLAVEKVDVVVPDGREVELDPEAGEFRRLFRRVRIAHFEDMQKLQLIPRELQEAEVHRAIAADDASALELASQLVGSPASQGDCGCRPTTRRLEHAYAEVRAAHNPALARAVSDSTGIATRWNDLHIAVIHKRVMSIVITPALLHWWLGTLADLVVGKNATVSLAASVKAVYGNGLKLHQGGKLYVKGSGVKLRFLTAQGDIA